MSPMYDDAAEVFPDVHEFLQQFPQNKSTEDVWNKVPSLNQSSLFFFIQCANIKLSTPFF